eukprot:GFKZ01014126.1.p1 GENE.GFKZ01014126.1~~GFKZ01014126.1.p1  ORF type:complete len:384 (-),score=42.07 GFKZ01014126.1:184-1335(-)
MPSIPSNFVNPDSIPFRLPPHTSILDEPAIINPLLPRACHLPQVGIAIRRRHSQRMNTLLLLFVIFGVLAIPAVSTSVKGLLPQKRVYTTNALAGFKKDKPSLWPPGFGGRGADGRYILDVGANNGDSYTLEGFKKGHNVFSFEPSPRVTSLFRQVMKKNHVDVALIKLQEGHQKGGFKAKKLTIPFGNRMVNPKVYLLPLALSNGTGEGRFHESPCPNLAKCGKLNHLARGYNRHDVKVQKFRLDDITLPVNARKIWFMKIDVEGHELEVLKGARKTIRASRMPYISLEFSSNGRKGTKWGVELLEELNGLGYVCYHLRGFGKCHDASFRSPSMKCNYPFPTSDVSAAPSFEEYTEVFEVLPGRQKRRRPMSDLMCAHSSVA